MYAKKRRNKWILILIVLVVAAAAGAGIWFAVYAGIEPVNVYPFTSVGMTDYWGDKQESYGPVTTDKIQTVFISETQTITEIKVKVGDQVKKGDLLMTFDTTLDLLAVERKGIEVEKLKLERKNAIHDLEEAKNLEPMYIPETYPEEPTEPNLGVKLKTKYLVASGWKDRNDGSTQEKAFVWWMNHKYAKLDKSTFDKFWEKVCELQKIETAEPETTQPAETEPDTTATTEQDDATKVIIYDPYDGVKTPSTTETTAPDETIPEETVPEELDKEHTFYLILKVTDDNMSNSEKSVWQGMKITRVEKAKTGAVSYSFEMFDASAMDDLSMVEIKQTESTEPEPDIGSGLTKQEIAEKISNLEKRIKQYEFDIRMAEAEYKLMQIEVSDGNVYAEIDGEIIAVHSEDEAREKELPLIKLSCGGGFFVEGSINELEKDNLMIGQEVTVNDWNTGKNYTGQVQQISDFPAAGEGWNGMGNPNASYYPFRVFIDGEANLQADTYVSISYSTSGSGNGIYLENPFIRTENGETYVLVMGGDGRIEKRTVTVGKSLWGSYQEILSGLTKEDLIAFPYGKNVKVGAPAVESDISALYMN